MPGKEEELIMDKKMILRSVDHTLLRQDATWEEVQEILDEAIRYRAASACIPPVYVRQAVEDTEGRLPICTVIGFPNGYSTSSVKVFEAMDAVMNGASEIDMVINIGLLKAGDYEAVQDEITRVKRACEGKILKVIVETCLLTEEEKIKMCEIVTAAGADYIKTSTGFAGGGATLEDIKLMKEHVGPNVKIKAAGGISSFEDAEKFLEAGASRLGTSRLIKLMES
jgi:deoxyribose-phosphate aldolase